MRDKRSSAFHRSLRGYILQLCMLLAILSSIGCTQGGVPNFENDDEGANSNLPPGESVEIKFELVEPEEDETLALTESDLVEIKVRVSTNGDTSDLNTLNVIWCAQDSTADAARRLCLNDDLTCLTLEGTTDEDQSREASLFGLAADLKGEDETSLSFTTTVRARLLEDKELTENPCAVIGSTDLTVNVEVLVDAVGPTTRVEHSASGCPTAQSPFFAVIPGKQKLGEQEKPIAPGARYIIEWFAIPEGEINPILIKEGKLDWTDAEYLCKPQEAQDDASYYADNQACLLKAQSHESIRKGAVVYVTARPDVGGSANPFHQSVELCNALPDCEAGGVKGELTFVNADGTEQDDEFSTVNEGVESFAKCTFLCYDGDLDDQITVRLNLTEKSDAARTEFLQSELLLPTLEDPVLGYAQIEHVFPLEGLVSVGDNLFCQAYPFPESAQQPGGDDDPYCCGDGCDEQDICYVSSGITVDNTAPEFSLAVGPKENASKSSDFTCSIKGLTDPDENDVVYKVDMAWENSDGDLIYDFEIADYNRLNFEAFEQTFNPIAEGIENSFSKQDTLCCRASIVENKFNTGFEAESNKIEKKSCVNIVNSPAVYVPSSPAAALVAQAIPLENDTPPCTDQAPLTVEFNTDPGNDYEFYAWQTLQCQINGTLFDPDEADTPISEVEFYNCNSDEVLYSKKNTDQAPPGQFLPHKKKDICCRIRACDGEDCSDFISQDFTANKGAAKVTDSPTLVNPATISENTAGGNIQSQVVTGFTCEVEAYDCDTAQPFESVYSFEKSGTAIAPENIGYSWTRVPDQEPFIESQNAVLSIVEADLGCSVGIQCEGVAKEGKDFETSVSDSSQVIYPENLAPEAGEVTITSADNPITPLSEITCSFDEVIDPENKLASVTLEWLRNGDLLNDKTVTFSDGDISTGSAVLDLSPGNSCEGEKLANPGDEFHCRIRAEDTCGTPATFLSETSLEIKKLTQEDRIEIDPFAEDLVDLEPKEGGLGKGVEYSCGLNLASQGLQLCSSQDAENYSIKVTFASNDPNIPVHEEVIGFTEQTVPFEFADVTADGCLGNSSELTCSLQIFEGDEPLTSIGELTSNVSVADPPNSFTVSLDSNNFQVNDTLKCVFEEEEGGDGEIGSPSFQWKINTGTFIDGAKTDTLFLKEGDFTAGDTIQCFVVLDDGCHPLNEKSSPPVAIENTPPTLSDVALSPENILVGDTLTCTASGYDDVDIPDENLSPEFDFSWEADIGGDGNFQALITAGCVQGPGLVNPEAQTLSLADCPDLIGVGDQIRCVVKPRDMNSPVLTGESLASNTVSLGNSPPVFTFVELKPTGSLDTAPSFDNGQSELLCDSELTDPDGTEGYNFAYTWTVSYPSGAEFVFETENDDTLDIASALASINQEPTACLGVKCGVQAFAPNEAAAAQFQESEVISFHRGGSLRFGVSETGGTTNPVSITSVTSDGNNPPETNLATGTIELIFFPEEFPSGLGHHTLLSGNTTDGEAWELRVTGTGQVAIAKEDGNKGTSSNPLTLQDWGFISLRWDANSTVIQVNGQKQAISTALSLVMTSLQIGSSANSPNGYLDELRVSKVAFDPTQDQAILKNSTNTVALYHFNLNETVIPADSGDQLFHGELPFLNPPVVSEHSIANTCEDPLCEEGGGCVTPPEVSISLAQPVEPGETLQTILCEASGAIDLNEGPLGSHNFQVLDPSNGNAVLGEVIGAGGSVAITVPVTGCRELQCRAIPISGFIVGTAPGFSVTRESCPPTTNPLVDFGCDDGESCSADIPAGGVCTHNANTGLPCDSVACLDGEQPTCSENATCACESVCDQTDAGPCQVVVFDADEPGLCKTISAPDNTPCSSDNACVPEGEIGQCNGGLCQMDEALDDYCDDGNGCTINFCGGSGCITSFSTDPCDDGNECSVNDTCTFGECLSFTPLGCNDGNQCTEDSCDEDVGCLFEGLNGEPCDDGDDCTLDDECEGDLCLPQGGDIVCDDGKQCTVDSCKTNGGCKFEKKEKNTPCDDGDVCTVGDACTKNGSCSSGANELDCDDDNPCTVDQCDEVAGCFTNVAAVNTPCDDGDACTTPDLCNAQGVCLLEFISCDDDEICTGDTCNKNTGCEHVPNTGLQCNDGDACTQSDLCNNSGECAGGPGLVCDDGEVCTQDSCDPDTGCKHVPAAATACDDGDACTALDLCFNGQCSGQNPIECSDNNPCSNDDSCNPATGECEFPPVIGLVPCDDGDFCTNEDQCSGLSCQGTVAVNCDDGDACTTDSCDSNLGCQQSVITCDDENECTSDICAPATGCVFTPTVGTVCDDGNPCTFNDICSGGFCGSGNESDCDDGNSCTQDFCNVNDGTCTHTISFGFPCSDGDLCTEGTTCEADGSCGGPSPVDCDDGNICTTTPCDSDLGCLAVPAAGPCEDGNLCTNNDTCVNGLCDSGSLVLCDDDLTDCFTKICDPLQGCPVTADQAPAGTPCSDGDICTEDDACPGEGADCLGTPVNCDDENPCTDDSCLIGVGCVSTVNTAICDDDTVCTENDICTAGVCSGTPKDCDDGNACTTNDCSEETDCTTSFKNGDACNDGDACTSGDLCSGGVCAGPDTVTCDDGNPCTGDLCAPASGCQHPPNTDPCNDGDACTQQDTCSGGVCLGTGGIDCPDDGNPCTASTCDPVTGCGHVNDDSGACDDGNACGAPDVCQDGVCTPGTPVICPDDGIACTTPKCSPASGCGHETDDGDCDDGEICTADSCQVGIGCVFTPTAESAPCDDGDICTLGEKCISGLCAGGAPANCDDGISCTADSCDSNNGCTHVSDNNLCDDGFNCTADACDAVNDCIHTANDNICNDGISCTSDSCDLNSGCVNTPANGLCNDGVACTTDACDLANDCTNTPVNAACDDGISCTTDTCDTNNDCSNTPNDQACDDGVACTADTCTASDCENTPNNTLCDDNEVCTIDICSPTGCIQDDSLAEGDACNDGDDCTENDACSSGVCTGADLTCCTPPPIPQVCGSQEASTFASIGAPIVACAGGASVNAGSGNICAYDEAGANDLEVCVQQDSNADYHLFNDSNNAPQDDECLTTIASGSCLNISTLFGSSSSLVVAGFGSNISDTGRVHFRCNFGTDCNGQNVANLSVGSALKCENNGDWTQALSNYVVVGGTIFGGQNAEHVFRIEGLTNTDDTAIWVRGETNGGGGAVDETANLVILGGFAAQGVPCTDSSVVTNIFAQSSNPLLVSANEWAAGSGNPGDSLCVFVEVINLSGANDEQVDLFISAGISGN